MATDLAKLVVRMEANSAKYVQGLEIANKKLNKFQRTQKTLLGRVQGGFSAVTSAARLFGAALSVSAVVTFIKRSAEFAENLDLMASRLGVNARELQAWQLIGERFGVQQTSLNTGIQRLTRRTAEAAKGMGEARGALRELGIDAVKFNNLSLDQRMQVLAQAFSEVRDKGEKVRLAFKLFGTEGVGFLQFLNEGEEGLGKLRKQLEGQIWSDEEREKLSLLNQKLTEISQTLQLTFAPALVAVGAAITDTIADSVKWLQDKLVQMTRLAQSAAGNQAAADKLNANLLPPVEKPPAARTARTKLFKESDVNPFLDKGVNTAFDRANKEASKEYKKQNDLLIARRELARDILAPMVQTTRETAAEMDAMIFGPMDEMAEKQRAFNDLFTENLIQAADGSFKSILESWSRTLIQMAARAASTKLLGALQSGSGKGGLFGAIGTFFGGAKAAGGPVSGGSAYLIGERGPELFIPSGAGNIAPNSALGGTNITVNAPNAAPGMEIRIRQAVQDAVRLSRADRNDSRRRGQ